MTGIQALQWHGGQTMSGAEIHSAITQRGRYTLTKMRSDSPDYAWHVTRMDHLLMPPFDGYCPDLDAAKRACEHDYIALQRADLWLDYMRDNNPPPAETI